MFYITNTNNIHSLYMPKIAVISANLSGLTLVNKLKHNTNITRFEASDSIARKVSIQHGKPYCFDHKVKFSKLEPKHFSRLYILKYNTHLSRNGKLVL